DAEIRLQPRPDGAWDFSIVTGSGEGQRVHSQGRLSASVAEPPAPVDLAALRAGFAPGPEPAALYRAFADRGLDYGPAFQAVRRAWCGGDVALVELALDEAQAATAGDYRLPPALLDAALQTMALLSLHAGGFREGGLYLPFALDSLDIHRHPGVACWVKVRRTAALPDHGGARFDLSLFDSAGLAIADLRGLTVRAVAPVKEAIPASSDGPHYFRPAWRATDALSAAPETAGLLVMFDQPGPRWDVLPGRADAVLVESGPARARLGERHFRIRPEAEEDYPWLFGQLAELGAGPWRLLDCRCLPGGGLEDGTEFTAALYLTKGLIGLRPTREVAWLLACLDGDGRADVRHAALSGFFRSLRRENPRLDGFVLTLDAAEATPGRFAAHARRELAARPSEAREIRYRAGRREIAGLELLDRPTRFAKPSRSAGGSSVLREGGVYLISGGLGGLGLCFACHLARHYRARLALLGRSPLNATHENLLAELRSLGAEALYLSADVADPAAVNRAVAEVRARFGGLHGVIHSAGVIEDGLILKKDAASVARVLAPKLAGTINLDEATAADPLDFFALCSSLAAQTGNVGQADYALANRFLDGYAERREAWRLAGRRHGLSVAINWPYWAEGGMRIPADKLGHLMETTGMSPLGNEAGCVALETCLTLGLPRVLVMAGDLARLKKFLDVVDAPAIPAATETAVAAPTQADVAEQVAGIIGQILKLAPRDIEPDANWEELGFDSITLTELATHLNRRFGLDLSPAHLFEQPSVARLAGHLWVAHGETFVGRAGTRARLAATGDEDVGHGNTCPTYEAEPIAIVGMSGVFPGSPDLAAFWDNLSSGRDLIGEIPPDRFDWRQHQDEAGRGPRWGGFIAGVDRFDAAFFKISPREAALMDPQQRVFLELAWAAIEDAGYRPSSLAGSRTGVFVGIGNREYAELLQASQIPPEAQYATGIASTLLPNRVSYLLDLRGPSEPVDTACSSALVAIHRAAQSLRLAECEMALAGGINLLLTPTAFLAFGQAGMLAPDGRCKSFDRRADGYVRGEGGGVLLLKPLSRALADGDTIHALVRGSAINHGGRAGSLTAPNPQAHAELYARAYAAAGFGLDSVGYIEAHGTGTELGDPVEISGLKLATERLGGTRRDAPHCALGTVKSNIGHLEAAAGIAGTIKTVLALRAKRVPASLHIHAPNPHIDLCGTPFFLADAPRPWPVLTDEHGAPLPRRAGVSSFGFGGVNAHLVLEEWPTAPAVPAHHGPELVPLSARDGDRLRDAARRLRDWLGRDEAASLADIAHTLRVGREPMRERLAFIAHSRADLAERLGRWLDGDTAGIWRGTAGTGSTRTIDPATTPEALQAVFAAEGWAGVAKLWSQGADLPFDAWERGNNRRRVSLPTYPFARERHWLSSVSGESSPSPAGEGRGEGISKGISSAVPHKVQSDEKEGNLFLISPYPSPPSATLRTGLPLERELTRRLRRDDPLIRDHVVKGRAILPAVVGLVLAREAAASFGAVVGVEQATWERPLVMEDDIGVDIRLTPEAGAVLFELRETGAVSAFARGRLMLAGADTATPEAFSPTAIAARCPARLDALALYTAFAARSLVYGESLRVVAELRSNAEEALAYLLPVPDGSESALLDGALQTAAGLLARDPERLYLPVALDRLVWHAPLAAARYVHAIARPDADGPDTARLDIRLAGADGAVLAELVGMTYRAPARPETAGLYVVEPWREAAPLAEPADVRLIHGGAGQNRLTHDVQRLPDGPLPPAFKTGGVYWITDGLGGLGLKLADYLAERYRARLLLTGRRKPDGAALARLAQLGAEVLYVPADAAKPAMMARAAELARRRFGPLNGVLHLAGSVRDGLLRDFSPDDLTGLFDAKIDGTQVLDRVTRDDPLDCFVLFDSLAAVVGNASQTGYAFANAYLNDYARHRAALVAAGERRGRSLALACSDWQDGGMSLAPEILAQRRAEFGLEPLSTADGWRVLEYALTAGLTDAGVVRGRADGLARLFGAAIRAETSPEPKSTAPDAEAAYRRAERHLRGLLADAIGMAPERIDPQAPLEDYGFSSLLIVKLSDLLERDFGRVPKTLFFEHRTLAGLAGHFAQHHAAKLAELYPEPGGSGLQPATEATPPSVTNQSSSLPIPARPENHDQPIAIIGLSGRYPEAPDLAAFWDNLAAGRDCVTESPPERWDWRQHFDPDQATPGKSYGRWGGFVADADKFDPLFFGITPHEAELMDPQERLFLQTAWHTVEDAGYGRRPLAGQDVGVFVGVMFGTYQLYGPEQFLRGNPVLPNSSYWSIANRVSYFFDFQGPSLAVDTACSSSLTAIHLAMEHLARGRCSMALAGGVNLSLHPYKYAGLSAGRFLSSDGRCRSFGAGGDGYVPGEGVGAVLLKPLDRALADGDHIYGVLRGSALNHGGKTNGYTVPNPDAQAALIKDALRRADVTPESIGYVEAHGTGTALGDPIELAALAKAWGGRASPAVCPIGSVKSNIGHLESAAGIAALTKVLLQLRHRRLVPSLHCETLNPDIDFDHSPFRPVREAQGWDALPGQPRRAAISSFGAGGSNAHLILEEAPPLESVSTPTADRPELILLSARDATRLRELAQGLADWLAADDSAVSLADIAHTLRQRDGLRTRLAIVCRDRADLADKLAAYLAGRVDAAIIQGEAAITAPEAAAQAAAWLRAGDSTRVAQAWTQGAAMDWSLLHPGERRRRVPLPGYPFARNRLWLSISDNAIAPPAPAPVPAGLHPLLDRNVSGFGGIAFEKAVHPDAFYLHDHRVAGRPVLPGVAHLEMARAAGELAAGRPVAALSDVVWIRPVEAANGPVLLRVALAAQTGKTGFEIGSAAGSHAQGRLWFDAAEAAPARDVAAIRARCVRDIPVGPLYDGFKARGLDYGPAFRALRELRGGDNEALARLELPPEVRAGAEGFVLHPSLMDGA
ncbi:SDR family NAD(P)-dependent oxidoreductase, partial [Methylomagnum sp.]